MRATIFVEGKSDERLISQFCKKLQNDAKIDSSIEIEVKSVGGWNVIDSDKGAVFRNMMMRNRDGKNLLVFDADKDPASRRHEILGWQNKYNIDFDLFLFPDNRDAGTVETLLERIINPENQCIMDCWHQYEEQLNKQTIIWKCPHTPTCPSEKSKIYGYLEALVGVTHSEKEKIKDRNRDFTEKNHWNLDAGSIDPLKDFLVNKLR